MKCYLCKTTFLVAAAAAVCLLAEGVTAAEGEKHSCACEAEEMGFKINCDDTATMLASMTALQADGCASDCTVGDCEKNWLIVQSHHDYCPDLWEHKQCNLAHRKLHIAYFIFVALGCKRA